MFSFVYIFFVKYSKIIHSITGKRKSQILLENFRFIVGLVAYLNSWNFPHRLQIFDGLVYKRAV